jgi:hypothetical protein
MPMTDMEQHFRAAHEPRTAAGPILVEYAVVLAVILLIGAVALAEVTGVLDGLVHEITFVL